MKRRTFLTTTLLAALGGRTVARAAGGCTVEGAPATQAAVGPGSVLADQLYLIGDWGSRSKTQRTVAEAMGALALQDGSPLRIISVGDNIYPNGVDSVDDPLWTSTFEDVYTQVGIKDVPWVAVLGNHDYRKSISAQIAYSKKNPRWIMPSQYFVQTLTGTSGATVALICLDTQMLLQKKTGWKDQLAWLEQSMAEQASATWKIVVGHHPMRSYGHYGDQDWMLKQVRPLMKGADLYACGHDHDLQIIGHPEDGFHCIVTGAGGGCRSTRWGTRTIAAATNGGFVRLDFDQQLMNLALISANGAVVGRHAIPA